MLYFNWLQKGNPTGKPDRFPELKNKFETSVPGLYCIGDLTGIPLIKLAAESGYELIEKLSNDDSFKKKPQETLPDDTYDLIIVGAGPAGISAGLKATDMGIKYLVLESSQIFNTIVNFPTGKPIHVTPKDPPGKSGLSFTDGNKESLLSELLRVVRHRDLPIREGEMVNTIIRESGSFTVQSTKGSYRARRVIIAIGKTGNARSLGIPGERLPHVFTGLIDPGEFDNNDIVVVGGGDSALEAAVALANTGNRVVLSYRKSSFSRPREQNLLEYEKCVKTGLITTIFNSTVKEIHSSEIIIDNTNGEQTVPADAVFVLIGAEIPIDFFRRSDIRMEGQRSFVDWIKIAGLIFFASVLYFGKKAPDTHLSSITELLNVPSMLIGKPWHIILNGLFAWGSLLGLVITMAYLTGHFIRKHTRYFTTSWNTFKYSYYFIIGILFSWLYIDYKLLSSRPVFGDMGDWYTVMYSLTIIIFGFRRMYVHPTGYIKRQTYLLMAIQVIPLCILPMFVFPLLGNYGILGNWVMTNVFPDGSYWRSYGFILAWPLFIHNLATGQPTLFWLMTGIIQTFILIPYIVYRWGKGAYCGWICSCGALAETLGDEYRTYAPHGRTAKKLENMGQLVLWFAGFVTLTALFSGQISSPLSSVASDIYAVLVDIIFAGVLGVGVYFSMSGRIWCRFFCPLAALMHIYARFSVYRIFSNKKRCISCNICTKVCHMGIDVMNFANKGIPMNDVQCVRCSACIVNCPLQVLTFGETGKPDLKNVSYKEKEIPLTKGWKSGLPEKDIFTGKILINKTYLRGEVLTFYVDSDVYYHSVSNMAPFWKP